MRTRQHRVLVAGMVVVGVLTMTGCSGDASSSVDQDTTLPSAPPSATTSPESGAIPEGDGPIEPGRYSVPSSAWSVADFAVTFPENWTVQYGHDYARHIDEDNEFGFHAVVVDEIFADACAGSNGGVTEVGPSVDDLATALIQQPGPRSEVRSRRRSAAIPRRGST